MSYPGEHGQSGGRPPESYDLNAYDAGGPAEPQGAAEQTATRAYDAVYDAQADYGSDYTNIGAREPGAGPREPGPGPREHGHRGPTPPRKRRVPLLVGGSFVALIALVGAGIGLSKVMGGDEQTPAGASTKAPAAGTTAPSRPPASPLPTGPLGAMLKSRQTDPRPLTLREVFNRKKFTVSRVRYVLTRWQATRACGKTMQGAKLVSAMRSGGCNQVLRGTFARADGKLVGTVGIANMRTARAATVTAKLANSTKNAYLQPLPGGGATRKLGQGIAYASAEARGHYVVFSWIQAPSGKTIPQSQRKAAAAFGPNVIYGTKLGFALQYRGIAGKPYGT